MPELSRWRALSAWWSLPHWYVVAEDGTRDESSGLFPEHKLAQQRADDLNRAEQYARIGAKLP